ncbi:MAG: hypothetical protein HQL65_04210 [Magnetococcales bacterium]|nr:hypothetical protein [Magnetococcales bacterium]
MRVILQADILDDETNWKHLDHMIHQIDSNAHVWDVEDPESIEKSTWFQRGRQYLHDLFEKSANQAVYPHPATSLHTKRVHVTYQEVTSKDLVLPPDRAATYLGQPLTILVENRKSDTLFGNTVLAILGPPELAEFRHNVPHALRFDAGGGNGELVKIVEEYVQNARNSRHPFRIVVFTDSDGKFPGDCSDNARRVEKVCKKYDVPYMLLKKRSIENYIPDEIFQAWNGKPKEVTALLRLSPEQRDYFPIKRGFSAKPERQGDKNKKEAELYASVAPADKETLQIGFGSHLIQLLETYEKNLSATGLLKRDGQGELTEFVNMIVREI